MIKAYVVALALSFIASTTHAQTIAERGNTNVDSTTGLEWLDLTETAGLTYREVLSKLAPGAELEGWRFATADELALLMSGFGLDSDYGSESNVDAANAFVAIMGDVSAHSPYELDYQYSVGYLEAVEKDIYDGGEFLWTIKDYSLGLVMTTGTVELPWSHDSYTRTPLDGAAGAFLVREVRHAQLPAALPILSKRR